MANRKATGRRLGRQWKEEGHANEFMFNAKFFRRSPLNFAAASADCIVNDETQAKLAGLGVEGRMVSLKSGSTAQFHLGNIEELSDKAAYERSLTQRSVRGRLATCGTHSISWDQQQVVLRDADFWWRILGKGDYYCQLEKGRVNYTFFAMREVIQFIVDQAEWRLLETGRIKGDLPRKLVNGRVKLTQVLTFEYRPEHGSFVIGAHGGQNGFKFNEILKQHIRYKTLR